MGVTRINVESARDMYCGGSPQVGDTDIFIAAAAVADFQPVTVASRRSRSKAVR